MVTLVGEQGQIDWAHFGHLQIGQAKRPLMAFVIVLSWSRRIFLRFSLDARMESFLRGHVQAFEAWGGRTAGRGKKSSSHRPLIPIKDIWLYPLRRDFASVLCR